jgi:aminoglycoside phosphotransferase (APT) family kinase protein
MASDLDAVTLLRWLEANIPGLAGPIAIDKFSGGQSNPTYRITAPSGAYVLRRKPLGALLASAHAVDREYRLLSALQPVGFPVPRPMALCTDPNVIGSIFYVMELVEGRTFWNGMLPGQTPSERRALYEAMIATLARLHAVDPAAVGLQDRALDQAVSRVADRGNRNDREADRVVAADRARSNADFDHPRRLSDR